MVIEATYLKVILPLKIEWEPYYYVPSDHQIRVGERVHCKFAGKDYVGVVSEVGVTPDIDTRKILPIESVDKEMEAILAQEISLWRQIADYYLCTVGEVYKAAYPLLKTEKEQAAAESLRKAGIRKQNALMDKKDRLEKSISKLQARLLSRKDSLEKARQQNTKEKYQKEIEAILLEISQKKDCLGNLLSDGPASCAKTSDEEEFSISGAIPTLSDAQQKALSLIKEGFQKGRPVLLNGVTGSGKTEIYMTLAIEALSLGKNVLYLVPEIALSRQLEARLKEAFGKYLLTFHSSETAARKRDITFKIREKGTRYVLLGTRSSLLLPHHDLGLVIVDEEHDSSYKQEDPAPRYNARETAIMLSSINHANTILGSATPSLEALYNCQVGRFALVELSQRYYSAQDAEIEIIDTIAERKKRGMVGSFSRKLIQRINDTLKEKGQVIILRARRAYSPVLQCSECGEIVKCPHCNVTMSLHQSHDSTDGRLLCHYCGHTEPFTGKCSKCQGELKPIGAGTQKIEEEAKEIFPDAVIQRLDSDSAKKAGFEKKTIEDFSAGKIDILIGTQIVTKGFDFKGLSLVAVIGADGILAQEDFRADEKAAQLFSQFRGRCSRRDQKGLFVIQTSQSEHPVYLSLAEKAFDRSQALLLERKLFGFPPYSRIINIILKDYNQARLYKMSSILASKISSSVPSQVTGPFAPASDRLSNQWIMHIRISLKKDKSLMQNKQILSKAVKDFEKEYSYPGHIHIDVDPC